MIWPALATGESPGIECPFRDVIGHSSPPEGPAVPIAGARIRDDSGKGAIVAQLGFAELDDGPGMGGAMIVRPGDQPDDGPGVGFGLSRVPSADEALIERWLHRKSPRTRRMYLATVRRFLATTGKALAEVTFGDLQDFDLSLAGLAESSRAVMIAIVKSLLTFGNRIGVLRFNVGAAYKAETKATNLNDRILTEPETQRLLASLTNPRDRTLLRLAYATAFRVSELVSMRWRDLHDRDGGGGQITVLGKGSKFRSSLVRPAVWDEVRALARLDRTSRSAIPTFLADGSLNPDAPVFRSRNGVPLGIKQVWRIVRRAAIEAGLTAKVSPHWLRHAHASHALDRGAPIHLVRDSLGHSSIATTNRYLHARPTEHSERFLTL